MFDARDIARELVRVGHSSDCPAESVYVSPLRLQKLLYYCQGWYLGLLGSPLFRQPVEAWKYGPVVDDVYRQFAGRREPILPDQAGEPSEPLPEHVRALVRMVWQEYAKYTPGELVDQTHAEPAWADARAGLPADAHSSAELSHDTMRAFFRTLVRSRVPAGEAWHPDPVEVWEADAEFDRTGGRGTPMAEVIRRAKAARRK